jgi:ornithine racemase
MQEYPLVEISLSKISHNSAVIVEMCHLCGVNVAGVTKGVCGNPAITKAMVDGGIDAIGDARVTNLKRNSVLALPKILLRLPMISQAREVIEFADISLNSEIETIKALSEAAYVKDVIHHIILMIDLGDLREGIFSRDEIFRVVDEIIKLNHIHFAGLGTNLTCYGGVIPTAENLSTLVKLKKAIENSFNISLETVSGGNSSSIYLVENKTLPNGINHLRLGESILLGRETAYGHHIEGTYQNCFKLIAEIIEIKDKPSIPIGILGTDTYGNRSTFIDNGIRRRAICAIGKQDVLPQNLIPDDQNIFILGASSDHLVLDITDSHQAYRVGSLVAFGLTYDGLLSIMTSEYVKKRFI